MARSNEADRIDLLLALALAFGESSDGRADAEPEEGDEGEAARGPLAVLSALAPSAWHLVERRADWYARLPPQKRRGWLAYMIGRARSRADLPRLDEHVHPSHIVEALRREPPRVRALVVAHLPPPLAAATAREFGPDAAPAGGRAAPAREVEAIVRREFLSRFVTLESVARPTPLDQLSGVELARLARLLGVRETAHACRGVEAVEAVASFLRRFAPEDAHAIAAHMASLNEVDPRRVATAGQTVREALLAEPEPAAMLDRVGLRLIALSLAGRDNRARLRYAAQKLPVEAARWLEEAARRGDSGKEDGPGPEVLRVVARETEAAAARLHRGRRPRPPLDARPDTNQRDAGEPAGPPTGGQTHGVGRL